MLCHRPPCRPQQRRLGSRPPARAAPHEQKQQRGERIGQRHTPAAVAHTAGVAVNTAMDEKEGRVSRRWDVEVTSGAVESVLKFRLGHRLLLILVLDYASAEMLNERSDFRDLIMEIISKQSEVRVGKKAKSNRFPFTLMLVVPDQKNFDNKGSEINIGYACVTHNWRFSSKLWFYVGASPCNSPEIRRRQCNLVTVEGREERQPLLCQEEMIGRSVPLPSPRGAPSASRCSYGRSAVNKDRGSSLYIWRRIRKEAILIYQPVQMTIECCGSGKHITLVTLVKMKMECVRHMIKNHEDAAAIYVLKHVFQFRFILMHLFTLLCYLTIVHWSSYFCFIFLAIFFNSLQQHVANIWPLYCPLLYEIFAHAIIVQTLHSESTCVCQYWLLFVAFFAFN